jgi:hypothetical protein
MLLPLSLLFGIVLGVTARGDDPPAVDAKTQSEVIDGIVAILSTDYVFPEVAKKMEEALRQHQASERYAKVQSPDQLALLLTRDLLEVSHDKHLHVNAMPSGLGAPPSDRDSSDAGAAQAWGNYAFEKVERLPGNIGYIKLDGFDGSDAAQPTAAAAMAFVAQTSALIFDLRDNGGGSPNMIVFLSSYLFEEPTHLNSFYNRRKDETTETWTTAEVTGRRYGEEKPVYVLTSNRTFSAAEEFTYNLKNLGRGTIVGETTGGGAHPVFMHRLNPQFVISVPFARAINPITKTNWEGVGVEPDIKVKRSDALLAAQLDALNQLQKTATAPWQVREIEAALRDVKAQYKGW